MVSEAFCFATGVASSRNTDMRISFPAGAWPRCVLIRVAELVVCIPSPVCKLEDDDGMVMDVIWCIICFLVYQMSACAFR